MQDAFIKFFTTGDTTQTVVFVILLLISFLLGMLVWALLAHLPASRKLKAENKDLSAENTVLRKDNKDLSERYTVVNAKLSRASEDLRTAEANLEEKNEKVIAQSKTIKTLSADLELYKDNARNFKEANEKLLEEYKKMSIEHEEVMTKMEDMKSLVEEVEQEKGSMIKSHLEVADNKLLADRSLKTTEEKLEKATERVHLLTKDLDAALEQKAELKKMVFNLESTQQLDGTDDDDLKTQFVGLKSHVRDLESENSDLMERLAPFLAKEQSDATQDEEIETLLVDLLVDAETNMEEDGFFSNYDESQLIEDKIYLEKTLAEESIIATAAEEEVVEVDEEDDRIMDKALLQVSDAMSLQGFYQDIDDAVLIESDEGIEEIGDEELMDLHLNNTAELFKKVLFYDEEAPSEQFIENEDLLKEELSKLHFIDALADDASDEVVLDDADHSDMNAALSSAIEVMNVEGLYAPIDADKLIASSDEIEEANETYHQEQDYEQTVLEEIGRSIPRAGLDEKDDLKRIDGIGMFIEQRLNQLGIYTYKQVSQFDEAFIANLGAALGFSEQTIARDEWVEQAKVLIG
jgi:predicted flap endonuclease-1-like 5' DNA nuclease